jgi:hypothetical protein
VARKKRELIEHWYRRDDNAVPAAFVLQSRDSLSAEDWSDAEQELHVELRNGVADLQLTPERRLAYEASATHLEIEHGVFAVPDAHEHVVCALRSIDGLPLDATAGRFIDLELDGLLDHDARLHLMDLRARLRGTLDSTVQEYTTAWSSSGPATESAEIVLDFDATDDPLHGSQEGAY